MRRMSAGALPQAGLEITSAANPRVKRLVALRHRRARDRAGVTLVEGYEELAMALSTGARPRELYVCPALAGPGAPAMIDRVSGLGAEVIRVSRPVFGKIAYRESPDGWLAVLPAVRTSLAALEPGPDPLVLICEGVEKPGNLGAILRTADATGSAAITAVAPAASAVRSIAPRLPGFSTPSQISTRGSVPGSSAARLVRTAGSTASQPSGDSR